MSKLEEVIQFRLNGVRGKTWECHVKLHPPQSHNGVVPTMAPGVYRQMTPSLKERYDRIGRWEWAPDADWLSLTDMEQLWVEAGLDEYLQEIKLRQQSNETDWPDDPAALFRRERLSYFAGSILSNERVFLLWLDITTEPEVWVCGSNGVARYAEFEEYLAAHLESDLSAFERGWEARPIAG